MPQITVLQVFEELTRLSKSASESYNVARNAGNPKVRLGGRQPNVTNVALLSSQGSQQIRAVE